MRRLLAAVAVVLVLLVGSAGPAAAYEPVRIVHTERVQAGPYAVPVGFSTWPVRALQSLDFSFAPEGGIAGLSGTLTTVGPDGRWAGEPLVRHPRDLAVWGLDIRALPVVDAAFRDRRSSRPRRGRADRAGAAGPAAGAELGDQRAALVGLVAFLTTAWRRTRPILPRIRPESRGRCGTPALIGSSSPRSAR